MSDLLEDRLRDEMHAAALALAPPAEMIREVSGRLRRRRTRRLGIAAGVAALVCAAGAAAVATSPQGGGTVPAAHRTHRPAPGPRPAPPVETQRVVHGPTLTDTRTGQTLRAIRTVLLPGGRSPIRGMTDGSTFYGVATLTNGVDLGNFQRLVRVSSSGQVTIGPVAMRAPTTPVVWYGETWVGDRHRLIGYDPTTLAVRHVVRLPGDLPGQVTAAGGYIWVAGWTHLDRVNPSTGALTRFLPGSGSERFAAVATTAGGQLVTGSSRLPDITDNIDKLAIRDPSSGAVVSSHSGFGIGATVIAGITGNDLWLSDTRDGESSRVDMIDLGTWKVQSPVVADTAVDVMISNGVPWVSASSLRGADGHGGILECLNPLSSPRGLLSVRRYPNQPADLVPAGTAVPVFFAAGVDEMFTTVGRELVIYPVDQSCVP